VSSGRCCLLFGLADFRVTFGKLQTDRLGHVGVEPDALLQKKWSWRKKEKIGREKERKWVVNTTGKIQKLFTFIKFFHLFQVCASV
jgi:hypothetical protein